MASSGRTAAQRRFDPANACHWRDGDSEAWSCRWCRMRVRCHRDAHGVWYQWQLPDGRLLDDRYEGRLPRCSGPMT